MHIRLKLRQYVPKLLLVTAAFVMAAGLAVAWRQRQENNHANAAAAYNQYQANHGHATGDNPSTQKPGEDMFQAWRVAPDEPRYIFIPNMGVKARVKQVGLGKSGAIGAPNNVFDAAWYAGSAKPGQPGATLIDGHVSSWTTHGVFYDLQKLQTGSQINITRGDGTFLTYVVVASKTYPSDKVDMKAVLSPIDAGKPGLNLITCAGNVTKGTSEFSQRRVIFAVQD